MIHSPLYFRAICKWVPVETPPSQDGCPIWASCSTQTPLATRAFEAIWRYKIFQPVCSEPSPSISTTTTPFPERTTNPGAEATTHWLEDRQPVFSLGGAKSRAARGPSCSQAPCGPLVNAQAAWISNGSDIAG